MGKYFTIILLFTVSVCAGQSPSFNSGLKFGLNTAQINGDDMGGFYKMGVVGGLYVNYPFSKKVKGQMEMLFSQKGSKRALVNGVYQAGLWHRLHLNYIEVPLLAVIKLTDKIDVQAGLGVGYLFSYKYEPIFGSSTQEFLKKYEVNMCGGASYRFSDHMSVFGRYTHSIMPINTRNTTNASPLFGQGHISMVASFGFLYSFRGE